MSSDVERMIGSLDLSESWRVSDRDDDSFALDFVDVSLSRLERHSLPGIDVYYSGNVWMLQSHDRIGDRFDLEHAGIVNHGKTIDCTHFDDAKEAIENALDQVEISVGNELRDAHERRTLTDGGIDVDQDVGAVDDVGLGALRHAIEHDGAALVWCEQCRRSVGVDRYGLRCEHDRDASPPLRSELFDDVFVEPTRRYRLREWLVDRLRAWL